VNAAARCWVFTSRSKEDIRRAYEGPVWGFWDRDAVGSRRSRLARNWRSFLFLKLCNSMSSRDINVVGIVRERLYDDQTPIRY